MDAETMKRFKDEKFKLVAKRKDLLSDPLTADEEEEVEDVDPGNGNGNGNGTDKKEKPETKTKNKIRMTRLSHDLYEYKAEVDEDDIEEMPDSLPEQGIEPQPEEIPEEEIPEEEGGDRNLLVFGSDLRMEMWTSSMAKRWPTRLNGRVDVGCSGTIISKDAVLTAGHCVWKYGRWRDMDFTPAQYDDAFTGRIERPYGKYNWRYVTTYTGKCEILLV